MRLNFVQLGLFVLAAIFLASVPAVADDEAAEETPSNSARKRNWFAAPVPVSGPTFGTGLVAGGAYFWKQTEAQRKSQPGSVSGIAGFASENDSRALGIGHSGYADEDKWRFGALAAYVDLNLELTRADATGELVEIDWLLKGGGFGGEVKRRIRDDWYAGAILRFIQLDQEFSANPLETEFDTSSSTRTAGLGLKLEFDSRDDQFFPRKGRSFKFSVLANSAALGSDLDYEAYQLVFSSFSSITESAVLAWEVQGCHRSSASPLWDACTIDLRGFNTTSYLGRSSASAQAEYRWKFHSRWAAVAFAGVGTYAESYNNNRDEEAISSYGAGIRFRVLKSQQVNVRLDFARSTDDNAIHLGVTEAF